MPGQPTVRKAQPRGGNLMIKKHAGSGNATGTRDVMAGSSKLAVPHNWPDTGPSARARKRADVVR